MPQWWLGPGQCAWAARASNPRHQLGPVTSVAPVAEIGCTCRAGMEPDTAQDNGYTIWHLAVEKNDIELLEFLSKNKADINAKNKDGLTALHMAAMKTGDVEFLVKMVSLGANPNLNTDFEETVLQLAQENELLNANDNDLSFLRN